MATEELSPRFLDLDVWPTAELLAAMHEGQLAAAAAAGGALESLAAAVDDAVPALLRGGRIAYAGAGTSGRIGVQDGAELAPTFGWPADRLVYLLAGGLGALIESVEGAEDDREEGEAAVAAARLGPDDVVLGIAASGTTPFTIAALAAAGRAGALTIAVAGNRGAPLFEVARHRILIETGPEVIAGSTRMKAGTAQKIVLNLFSSAVMVRLGRVYRGQMVHMRASNAKLRRRAELMVRRLVGCSAADAARHVRDAGGDVKTAVMLGLGLDPEQAAALLERHGGNLRRAIAEAGGR